MECFIIGLMLMILILLFYAYTVHKSDSPKEVSFGALARHISRVNEHNRKILKRRRSDSIGKRLNDRYKPYKDKL